MGNKIQTLDEETTGKWTCTKCTFFNSFNESNCKMCGTNTNVITIPVQILHPLWESWSFRHPYSSNITMQDLFDKVVKIINKRKHPKIYGINSITSESFIGKVETYTGTIEQRNENDWKTLCSKTLTEYDLNDVINKGLVIEAKILYQHKIKPSHKNDFTCKHMQRNDNSETNNALQCPVYKSMKVNYEYSESNLKHLYEFTHFKDEYNEKPKCKYYQDCKSFLRLENGENRLDDKCHIKLFNHPPRNDRQIELSENTHSFIMNTQSKQNHKLINPTTEHRKIYKYNHKNGFVNALAEEVVTNGFKYDLCLECSKGDDCKHESHSLLSIVDEKLNHIRHQQISKPLNRGEMLALVLYTGCECNYDLCASQRNNCYSRWKWFDYCLYHAISKLSLRETGDYKLYSGLNKVKLNKKQVLYGWFPTYTSTSWIKDVSVSFMGDEGMVIEFDENYRRNQRNVICCDVSWISKFPDECEILISRSVNDWLGDNVFTLSVLDEQNGIQTVGLKHVKTTGWKYYFYTNNDSKDEKPSEKDQKSDEKNESIVDIPPVTNFEKDEYIDVKIMFAPLISKEENWTKGIICKSTDDKVLIFVPKGAYGAIWMDKTSKNIAPAGSFTS